MTPSDLKSDMFFLYKPPPPPPKPVCNPFEPIGKQRECGIDFIFMSILAMCVVSALLFFLFCSTVCLSNDKWKWCDCEFNIGLLISLLTPAEDIVAILVVDEGDIWRTLGLFAIFTLHALVSGVIEDLCEEDTGKISLNCFFAGCCAWLSDNKKKVLLTLMELTQFGLLFGLTLFGSAGFGSHSIFFLAAVSVQVLAIWLPLKDYFSCMSQCTKGKNQDVQVLAIWRSVLLICFGRAQAARRGKDSEKEEKPQAKAAAGQEVGSARKSTALSNIFKRTVGGAEEKEGQTTKTAEKEEKDKQPEGAKEMLFRVLERGPVLDLLVTINRVKDKDEKLRRVEYQLETAKEKKARDKKNKNQRDASRARHGAEQSSLTDGEKEASDKKKEEERELDASSGAEQSANFTVRRLIDEVWRLREDDAEKMANESSKRYRWPTGVLVTAVFTIVTSALPLLYVFFNDESPFRSTGFDIAFTISI
ncbi:unnamed protein product [Vitrella brassicaformis CCMP3155]|uniref:Uncharacterized protein n=1 Tax=Vitrella brassicaformis (strain CCMP3155) TaxID=1169540 RepID=A0A0G4EPD3_VITBC|nr:unnamed protein product [Vitrella brassicaformis CCMP3155]|eukprot:CEL99289.1 unnamed protein product [Vitrella brassicaformis CCMP3155]